MNDPSFCPDPTVLAAFVDGRLSAAARREVVVHLDRCELCYETVVETVRFQSEEEPRGRVLDGGRFGLARKWWLGAAAAATLLVAALLIWPVLRVDPERPVVATLPGGSPVTSVSPATLAALEENLWPLFPDEGDLAQGFAPPAREALGFRIGVRLADLQLAAAAETTSAYRLALSHLERTLEASDRGRPLKEELDRAHRADSPELRSEAVETLSRSLAKRADSEALAFGLWAETSRIAAAAKDREYLGSSAFSAGLSRLPPGSTPPELAARLEGHGRTLDAAAIDELTTILASIISKSGGGA